MLLSGPTHKKGSKASSPGQDFPKDSRIHPPFLTRPYIRICVSTEPPTWESLGYSMLITWLEAAEDYESCLWGTRALLQTLQEKAYRVSAKKAQLCQSHSTYLGFDLHEGVRSLSESRKQVITRYPCHTMSRQVREFLGTVGYCRLCYHG